ncbi:MAG TPA: cytochrome c [Bacteroides sp.]|nr:cytochrome c [Bacteroides sp.]
MKRTFICIAVFWMAVASCDRTRSSTGWDYMPDMYYSRAYETYTSNPNFSDSMTMRVPVKGTVPREMIPFDYENNPEDRTAAGNDLVNPLEATVSNLERGRAAYGSFCASCHGAEGDGQGFLFTSGRYPYPPASLVSEQAGALKDGAMYHTIAVGYGIMGAHGGMIRPADRWKIVLYIRENLQK